MVLFSFTTRVCSCKRGYEGSGSKKCTEIDPCQSPTRGGCHKQVSLLELYLLLRPFSYLESMHKVFILHIIRTCDSSFCGPTPFSFVSVCVTSVHLSLGLPVFCVQSLPCDVHVVITTSSVFLFTYRRPYRPCFSHFLPMFATFALPGSGKCSVFVYILGHLS